VSTLYLETSGVLAWLLGQPRGDEVRAAVDRAETVVTSTLTRVESERALVRAHALGLLKEGDVARLRGILRRAGAQWTVLAVVDEVLERAARPFPVEPARTLDAMHLATALELTKAFPDLRMLSLDRRIADNATALGL
jgi:predicted nucleic acid-binding protein